MRTSVSLLSVRARFAVFCDIQLAQLSSEELSSLSSSISRRLFGRDCFATRVAPAMGWRAMVMPKRVVYWNISAVRKMYGAR